MLRVVIPKDKKKIEQQIAALKYQISIETNEKDKKIFQDTLKELEKAIGGESNV